MNLILLETNVYTFAQLFISESNRSMPLITARKAGVLNVQWFKNHHLCNDILEN